MYSAEQVDLVCYAYPRSEQPTKDSALDNLIPDWVVRDGTHLICYGNHHELKCSIVVFWGRKNSEKTAREETTTV